MSESLRCMFVYCDWHDQGSVAIITHKEWQDITNDSEVETDYNYEKIFTYVDQMCGGCEIKCKNFWVCKGFLIYNPKDESLTVQESVQTNFKKECGGWKFEYFKYDLYSSKGLIEAYLLPRAIKEYLSHLDSPNPKD